MLTYKDGQYYNLANWFMLAHPYGHPKVMSSYYFTDTDAGPPGIPVHDGDSLNCDDGSTWVCEHRRDGIASMVGFRMETQGTDAANWQFDSSNGNRAAFTRGETGFFAINMDTNLEWSSVTVVVGVPDGSYCNVISASDLGSCTDTVKVVDGKATITIGTLSAVAIHTGAML